MIVLSLIAAALMNGNRSFILPDRSIGFYQHHVVQQQYYCTRVKEFYFCFLVFYLIYRSASCSSRCRRACDARRRRLVGSGRAHAKVPRRRWPATATDVHVVLRRIQTAIRLGHGRRLRHILCLLRLSRSECAFLLHFLNVRRPVRGSHRVLIRLRRTASRSGNTTWWDGAGKPSGSVNRGVTCPENSRGIRWNGAALDWWRRTRCPRRSPRTWAAAVTAKSTWRSTSTRGGGGYFSGQWYSSSRSVGKRAPASFLAVFFVWRIPYGFFVVFIVCVHVLTIWFVSIFLCFFLLSMGYHYYIFSRWTFSFRYHFIFTSLSGSR